MPPALRLRATTHRTAASYSISSTSRPARSPARKSSTALGALAALAGRANAGAERDQRRAEVAALARAYPGGAQRLPPTVAAAADLAVGDLPREPGEQPVGRVRQRRHGVIAPIRTVAPSLAIPVEAASVQAAACAPAAAGRPASSGIRIVPPARTVTPSAVAEELGRFVGGGRHERFR